MSVSRDQNADQNRNIQTGNQIISKCAKVQLSGNDSNTKFDSGEIKR
jgi:hypothetical protein